MKDRKIETLINAATNICEGNIEHAKKVIEDGYPFIPIKKDSRSYSSLQMMEQFFRDGFIDRYSGEKLINPGMLRTLSELMPQEFPYQANWKMEECHIAYWDYQPTIDHIIPIALGGLNNPTNWATTSQLNNSAKRNFTLEQLKWKLWEPGKLEDWDGLSRLFIQIVQLHPELLKVGKIKEWNKVTCRCFDNIKNLQCQ